MAVRVFRVSLFFYILYEIVINHWGKMNFHTKRIVLFLLSVMPLLVQTMERPGEVKNEQVCELSADVMADLGFAFKRKQEAELEHKRDSVIYSKKDPLFELDEDISLVDALLSGQLEIRAAEPHSKKGPMAYFKHYRVPTYVYAKSFFTIRLQLGQFLQNARQKPAEMSAFVDNFLRCASTLAMPVARRTTVLKHSFLLCNIAEIQKWRLTGFASLRFIPSKVPPCILPKNNIGLAQNFPGEIKDAFREVIVFWGQKPISSSQVKICLERLKQALFFLTSEPEGLLKKRQHAISLINLMLKNGDYGVLESIVTSCEELLALEKEESEKTPQELVDSLCFLQNTYNATAYVQEMQKRIKKSKEALCKTTEPTKILDIMHNLRGYIRDHLSYTPECENLLLVGACSILNEKLTSPEALTQMLARASASTDVRENRAAGTQVAE